MISNKEHFKRNQIGLGLASVPNHSPASVHNRLEALMVLINSVLIEIDEMKKGDEIAVHDGIDFNREIDRFEANLIRCALTRCGGNQRRAATLLNLKVTTLNTKIKRIGITLNEEVSLI